MEKIFSSHVSYESRMQNIQKNTHKSHSKRTNSPIKHGQRMNRQLSKKMCKWSIDPAEKMFTVISYWRNTNKNHNEILLLHWMAKIEKKRQIQLLMRMCRSWNPLTLPVASLVAKPFALCFWVLGFGFLNLIAVQLVYNVVLVSLFMNPFLENSNFSKS